MPFVSSVRGAYGPQDKALREAAANIETGDLDRVRQQYRAVATGGTITAAGGYVIHTFTSTGNSTFDTSGLGTTNVEYLVVGAGGGGAGAFSGGGGAGGLVLNAGTVINSGTYPVVVGTGGSGGTGWNIPTNGPGKSGGQSSFNTNIIASGGGGGGQFGGSSYASNPAALPGGSGGGGASLDPGASSTPNVAGNSIQSSYPGHTSAGFAGGSGGVSPFGANNSYRGGGGGGAGGVGTPGAGANTTAGDGGTGLSVSISGTPTFYAGGGAGSGQSTSPRSGGSGGGGPSGVSGDSNTGVPGTNGLGGGGGGKEWSYNPSPAVWGGSGGNGTVVIRYLV